MIPRSYQIGALDGDDKFPGAFACWRDNRSTLVQLPTGCGKTFVAAQCAKRQLGRTLFIVHLREIVLQARDELHAMTGLPVGRELASFASSTLDPEPIVVASVQTMQKRLNKFPPEEFSLVIGDEIHHGVTKTWQNVFEHFKQNPECKILGLSATPERADKRKLGEVIESIAYEYSLKDAVNDGWLVKPRQLAIEVPGLDFTKIQSRGGDLAQDELAREMERLAVLTAHRSLEAIFNLAPHELDAVPEGKWNEYIGERKARRTLAFCVRVKHAEAVANALNTVRPGLCETISGETPHEDRRRIFRAFKHGELMVLANCGVTVEGYDNPGIEVVLMLRPTKSKPLYLQMIGRATRTLKGTLDGIEDAELRKIAIAQSKKPFAVIVDFTGNSGKHKLISVPDVFGEVAPHIKRELIKRAKEDAIDIEEETKKIELEIQKRLEAQRTDFEQTEIDGFTGKRKGKKKKGSTTKRMTPGIFEYLKKQKLHPERYSDEQNLERYGKCQHRRLAGLCSYGQVDLLHRYDYAYSELEHMTFEAARNAIDRIAQNGWKKNLRESFRKTGAAFTTNSQSRKTFSELNNAIPRISRNKIKR